MKLAVPPSACLDEDIILRFADGSLEGGAFESAKDHLDGCEGCRALAAMAAQYDGATTVLAKKNHAAASPRREPGGRVGRYELGEELGAGGMGVVYKAYDPQLARHIALKLVRPDLGWGTSERGRPTHARLLREAQAMAQLSHPNVVQVHDAGLYDDQLFLALELIDGQTLAAWLRRERRTFADVLERLLEAGRGLAAAHAAGLVHRDFKPANILVGRDGRARVTDFGLARPVGNEPPETLSYESSPRGLLDVAVTQTGSVAGTPAYMAPEQLRGAVPDPRSDQFSYGCVLYEACYGRRPFPETSFEAREAALLIAAPLRFPNEPAVPPRVRAVIERALSVHPDDRFPSMEILLEALGRASVSSRRWPSSWAVAASSTAVILVAFAVFGSRRAEVAGPPLDKPPAAAAVAPAPAALEVAAAPPPQAVAPPARPVAAQPEPRPVQRKSSTRVHKRVAAPAPAIKRNSVLKGFGE